MSIRVNIPTEFERFTGGRKVAEVNGRTVGECLDDLARQFPGIETALCRDGKLLSNVDVYINRGSSYPEELAKPVKDGDELHIMLLIIAGG